MSTTSQTSDENLIDRLSQHVFVVLLRVSWPKLSYKIADVVVSVSNGNDTAVEIEERFRTNPQWNLMPAEWFSKFGSIEYRARKALMESSIQFATRGIAAIPISRASQVFWQLRELKTEMENTAREFCSAYATILAELRAGLGEELYKLAIKAIPTVNDIARKFDIVWAILPIGGSPVSSEQLDSLERLVECVRSTSADTADLDAVREVSELIQKLKEPTELNDVGEVVAQDLVREAKQQMERFTTEMLEEMSREPREQLVAALDNLLEAMQDPGRAVRQGTIGQVQRAFELVRSFSFVADAELLRRIENCGLQIDKATPGELKSNTELAQRVAAALTGVREAAADAAKATAAVRQFRRVQLSPEAEQSTT